MRQPENILREIGSGGIPQNERGASDDEISEDRFDLLEQVFAIRRSIVEKNFKRKDTEQQCHYQGTLNPRQRKKARDEEGGQIGVPRIKQIKAKRQNKRSRQLRIRHEGLQENRDKHEKENDGERRTFFHVANEAPRQI